MFKFPFNWLMGDAEIKVDKEHLLEYLSLQGFEIASIEATDDDTLIEIEVKANRPDMLSVAGVLREYYGGTGEKKPKEYPSKLAFDFGGNGSLSREILINSADVHEYYAVEIEGINNAKTTPSYITERLKKMGVDSINPAVDVGNYILYWLGQPIHIFDRDKVKGAIKIENAKSPRKFKTLAGTEVEIPAGALTITDDEKVLCLAGMIGSFDAAVDKNTKNIIIESANFDHVVIRTVGKKLKLSTAAAYRFERGVARANAKTGALNSAELIIGACGGKAKSKAFHYADGKKPTDTFKLSLSRVNGLLGSTFSAEEAAGLLNKCYFETEIKGKTITVKAPWWRLDIEDDVDLIEEIGRMYGYHNITPQPIAMRVPERKNPVNENSDKLRGILAGFGFIECLNYGFISGGAMETLGLKAGDPYFGDITLKNPLSNLYSLMRPTLAYGLIETAVNNLKRGAANIKIFEIGKTFFRDKNHEDGYNEKNVVAGLMSGAKYKKGFGQGKELKYSVFDAVALAKSLLDEFCADGKIVNSDKIKFLAGGACAEIIAGDQPIGCVGLINPAVYNSFDGNVIKDDMFYFEIDFGGVDTQKRQIRHESNFPTVRREYNFLVKSGTHYSDYKEVFKHELIIDARPVDVYQGQGVPKGFASVLISVAYNSPARTLESAEIDTIEKAFKQTLKTKYGIELKM